MLRQMAGYNQTLCYCRQNIAFVAMAEMPGPVLICPTCSEGADSPVLCKSVVNIAIARTIHVTLDTSIVSTDTHKIKDHAIRTVSRWDIQKSHVIGAHQGLSWISGFGASNVLAAQTTADQLPCQF
jgi:hypothetical protein